MSKRYTVAEGQEFIFPADPITVRAIADAGGLSKMPAEAREKLNMKRVVAGDDCSAMPEGPRELYVSRGWILVEETEEPKKPEPKPAAAPPKEVK